MILSLALGFGLTAFIYSLAGFAGGSTYLGLLTLAHIPAVIIPALSLSCNIVVSCSNSVRYWQNRLLRPRLLLPHMALAIPLAYLGGRTALGKDTFLWLTAISLFCAALALLIRAPAWDDTGSVCKPPPLAIALPAGAILGFISGLIGIGGGIFLAPLLYGLKAGTPKEIGSTCTFFIAVNSLAGLAGQLHKFTLLQEQILPYWPLPLMVLAGGWAGNHLMLKILSLRQIAFITGMALFTIDAKLWWDIAAA